MLEQPFYNAAPHVVFTSLRELQPHHWTDAYADEMTSPWKREEGNR